ncbi:MAG TPA: ABC transporter ATP-binding protein [Devosiaceae bacterium]|jgi:peptide/nickel transport system ATP-binding protein
MSLVEAHGLGRMFAARRPFRKPVLIAAVNGVDLAIERGETLAIVGESGCGKSTLGRLLLGLLPASAGSVRFDGADLAALSAPGLRQLRSRMQIVFQNTLAALDPRMPVGRQIAEPLAIHGETQQGLRHAETERLMRDVGLDTALMERRPHELSGGQRQRVVIARALATRPSFVVFDEPVSALDVSVQAQIIALIRKLQASSGFASAFISHDLRVVRHVADRVAVMYLGRIVEEGPVAEVFRNPAHPYTRALIGAVPQIRPGMKAKRQRLAGEPANPSQMPSGCAFHPRCPAAMPVCAKASPGLADISAGRAAACHLLTDPQSAIPQFA